MPEEVPDPQAPETFARSKLDWSEASREPHRTLLDWHAPSFASAARPGLPGEGLDQVRVRYDEADRWLVLERDAVTVACNLAGRAQRVPLGGRPAGEVVLASDRDVKAGAGVVDLPPESVVVLRGMIADSSGIADGYGTPAASGTPPRRPRGPHCSPRWARPRGRQRPVRVVRAAEGATLAGPAELRLEDGTALRVDGALPPDLPLGYHELRPLDGGRRAASS